MQGSIYRELKGATFAERQAECPRGYWYQKADDGTEVWYNPHGMYCPLCKTECADMIPNPLPGFLCPACGFSFVLNLHTQDVGNRHVVLCNPD